MKNTLYALLFMFSAQSIAVDLSLAQIMADPDWLGNAPTAPYWGDDNESVYYWQKETGSKLYKLYKVSIQSGKIRKVPLDYYEQDRGGEYVYDADKEYKAFTKDNNVYVKAIANTQVRQLTKTTSVKRQLKFLNDGSLIYRESNTVFRADLKTGLIEQFITLLTHDDPDDKKLDYLQGNELRFFDVLQQDKHHEKEEQLAKAQRKKLDSTLTNEPWYLGSDVEINEISVSPSGEYAIVSTFDANRRRGKKDLMPKYVNSSGYVQAVDLRAKVGTDMPPEETLWLLDLSERTRTKLDKGQLPEINEERLSELRKEKARQENKKYKKSNAQRETLLSWRLDPIKWNSDGDKAAFMLFSYDNKDRWFVSVDVDKKELVNLEHLYDEAWVNDSVRDEYNWINSSDNLYFLSEKTGFRHLYQTNSRGKVKALTAGRFEVSQVVSLKKDGSFLFIANQDDPGVYEVYQKYQGDEKLVKVTLAGGKNEFWLSPNQKQLLLLHSTVTRPGELFAQSKRPGTPRQQLTNSSSKAFMAINWTKPSIVKVPSSKVKQPIYARLYKPNPDNDKNKAVIFVHGAGYLQNAHHGWSYYFREFMFHSMLNQKGYTVLDMDYRASQGYGRDWRTAIYRNMGTPELEDILDGKTWLVKEHGIDENKVGIYGGSYGGFMAFMALFKAPDAFAAGAALRPVTDWAHYNHGYTSNILNTPDLDPEAYRTSSPIEFAEGLSKPLLICAGMLDDNVFFQDSVRLVQRLIELKKQNFELAVYPIEAHSFVQPSSWLDEYSRILKLFETHI